MYTVLVTFEDTTFHRAHSMRTTIEANSPSEARSLAMLEWLETYNEGVGWKFNAATIA